MVCVFVRVQEDEKEQEVDHLKDSEEKSEKSLWWAGNNVF